MERQAVVMSGGGDYSKTIIKEVEVSDTYTGVCRKCEEETDLIEGICENCSIEEEHNHSEDEEVKL